MSPGLILDCDGVLADTELGGHLPAFNRTFAELGLPLHWSVEEYGRLLPVGGGKERMLHALRPDLLRETGLSPEPANLAREAARWHAHKTQIFRQMIASGAIRPRSGVRRLVTEAIAAGWRVAVASTSAEAAVEGVLGLALGRELAEEIDVLAGDVVAHKKPAPDIYLVALERLGVRAGQAIAIEDSRNGLLAATGAGIACIVTRSAFTQDEDMEEATVVLSELGDPGSQAPQVELNRTGVPLAGALRLAFLEACLEPARGRGASSTDSWG